MKNPFRAVPESTAILAACLLVTLSPVGAESTGDQTAETQPPAEQEPTPENHEHADAEPVDTAELKEPKEKKPKEKKPKEKKPDEDSEDADDDEEAVNRNNGDWCEWLSGRPGLLYSAKRKENPYFQSFRVAGRFQYQAAHVSGRDVNGRSFSDSHDEFRRARIETRSRFLKYFQIDLNVNLVSDDRFRQGDLDWGYNGFDSASITFDVARAFGGGPFDGILLTYGRMKVPLTEEAHLSSRRLLTLERSAISDKMDGEDSRPTGVLLELEKDDWEASVGIFSGEISSAMIAGWSGGTVIYTSVSWQVNKDFRLLFDYDRSLSPDNGNFLGYAWGTSLAGIYEKGRLGLMVNGVYGDNGGVSLGQTNPDRQGNFYGLVATPWYWLVEERLRIVASYRYQGSERDEGVRTTSRYARASHNQGGADLNNGRGDSHHSVYLGLNYYLCGHNAKLMGGLQYEEMQTPNGRFDATSYLIGFRMYF